MLREQWNRHAAVAVAAVAVALWGCVDASTAPTTASEGAAVAALSASGSPVVQSVTGNGHLADTRTYTFQVHKRADGTVSGWMHVRYRGPGGAHIRVEANCLHVVGNQAWVGGVIVFAADPANVGLPYSFKVVDNGEGANAPPDEIRTEHVYHDCTSEWGGATRALTIGNLQVRG